MAGVGGCFWKGLCKSVFLAKLLTSQTKMDNDKESYHSGSEFYHLNELTMENEPGAFKFCREMTALMTKLDCSLPSNDRLINSTNKTTYELHVWKRHCKH